MLSEALCCSSFCEGKQLSAKVRMSGSIVGANPANKAALACLNWVRLRPGVSGHACL